MLIKFINTQESDYINERYLRAKILREPLGLPLGTEVFPFEHESLHLVAIDEGKVIGCVLFHREGETGRIFQMAVAEAYQKKGVGTKLLQAMESRLSHEGLAEVYLHARKDAVLFYEKLGYKIHGEEFTEIGIRHNVMKKKLRESNAERAALSGF